MGEVHIMVQNKSGVPPGGSNVNVAISDIHKSSSKLTMKLTAQISYMSIGCPTIADDIAIAILTVYAMQNMLNVAVYFMYKWRFLFSAPIVFSCVMANMT